MSGKKISGNAERALATAIQRDRERVTGNNGEGPDERQSVGWGLLLGKLQADLAAGNSGQVAIWGGSKGGETDASGGNSNSPNVVKVYNRFADLKKNAWVIFAAFDQGYEILVANPCNPPSS